jgi:hypothetical protein
VHHFDPQGQDDRAKGGEGQEVSLIHRHTPMGPPREEGLGTMGERDLGWSV